MGTQPTLSIYPLLPPASNSYWTTASERGKEAWIIAPLWENCYASKCMCLFQKREGGRERNQPDTSRLLQTISWAIVMTALAKLQRGGALRRRDCRSWPSFFFFLVWSETCAPLPFPHPNLSLYYYRLVGGGGAGSAWSEVSGSLPHRALCVLPGTLLSCCCLVDFFFSRGLIAVCDMMAPVSVVSASSCVLKQDGQKGLRFFTACQSRT